MSVEQEAIDTRELAPKDRASHGLGDLMAGRATEGDGECRPDADVPVGPTQCEDADHNHTKLRTSAIVSSIRARLEQHPHFRGWTSLLTIESIDGSIVLSGRLPSYYLKQLLQEAIRESSDVTKIDNHVEVVCLR